MVQCIIVVVYSADCCRSVALLCSGIIVDSKTLSSLPFLFLVKVGIGLADMQWVVPAFQGCHGYLLAAYGFGTQLTFKAPVPSSSICDEF